MKSSFFFLNRFIKGLAYFLIDIGLDPRRLIYVKHLPTYLFQLREFKFKSGIISRLHPILSDFDEEAGTVKGHYFHQDLLVASFVFQKNPRRHIDVGSRIDGLVAHIASFRKIDVMDVRDLGDTGHKNISFIKADLMNSKSVQENLTDSLSCLHAIEHFGLGRYGDPIEPNGHISGFQNILRMLAPEGALYISFPIGRANETHFNAHRIFHPLDIFSWAKDPDSLLLERFDFVDGEGSLHQDKKIGDFVASEKPGCGIYTFKKLY